MNNSSFSSFFFILLIILVLLTVFGIAYLYITSKTKERLALIEKGMDPNLAKSDFWLQIGIIAGGSAFGLIAGDKSEWFISAKKIGSMYDPGSMIYSIEDPILGRKGNLGVTVLALYDREGVIIKIEGEGIPENVLSPNRLDLISNE